MEFLRRRVASASLPNSQSSLNNRQLKGCRLQSRFVGGGRLCDVHFHLFLLSQKNQAARKLLFRVSPSSRLLWTPFFSLCRITAGSNCHNYRTPVNKHQQNSSIVPKVVVMSPLYSRLLVWIFFLYRGGSLGHRNLSDEARMRAVATIRGVFFW